MGTRFLKGTDISYTYGRSLGIMPLYFTMNPAHLLFAMSAAWSMPDLQHPHLLAPAALAGEDRVWNTLYPLLCGSASWDPGQEARIVNTRHTRSLPSMALALGKPQGYVMLARSGGQGAAAPLRGAGIPPHWGGCPAWGQVIPAQTLPEQ